MDDLAVTFADMRLHETRVQYEKEIVTLKNENAKLRTEIEVLVKTLRYAERLIKTIEDRKQKIPNWIY